MTANGTGNYEIIIVGAGPAGQTAALYAGRSRIPTLVLEKGIPGGQLWNTAEVEDYPGFEHIMGPDLADKIQQHAQKFGATFETGEVVSISADGDDRVVRTADGQEFRAPAVIVTVGGEARKLGVPGEDELAGQGRLLLRRVRRGLLRGRRHRRRGRRRLGRRGGHVPDPLRAQGEPDPPPGRLPRAADPGRADARDRQGRRDPEQGRWRRSTARTARCRT